MPDMNQLSDLFIEYQNTVLRMWHNLRTQIVKKIRYINIHIVYSINDEITIFSNKYRKNDNDGLVLYEIYDMYVTRSNLCYTNLYVHCYNDDSNMKYSEEIILYVNDKQSILDTLSLQDEVIYYTYINDIFKNNYKHLIDQLENKMKFICCNSLDSNIVSDDFNTNRIV